jgi:hypothetical protein
VRIHPLFKLTDRSQGFGVDAIPGQRQPQLVVETHRDRWDQKPVEDVEALGPRQAYLAKEFGSSLSGSASTKGAIYRMRLLLSPAILESTRNSTTLTPTLWPTSCNPTLDVQFNLPRRTTSDSYSRAPLTQGRPGTSSQHRTLCSEPQMVGSSYDPPLVSSPRQGQNVPSCILQRLGPLANLTMLYPCNARPRWSCLTTLMVGSPSPGHRLVNDAGSPAPPVSLISHRSMT